MCMFCAAIPATAAIGANLNAKQKATQRAAEEAGIDPPPAKPVARLTLTALIALAIGSVVYHTVISPILGLTFF